MNWGPRKVQKIRSLGWVFLDVFNKFLKISEVLSYEIKCLRFFFNTYKED